ncbi:hypothetical protein FRC01_007408 [Tulasnella sp. 417]|nr:hypothetical protein FRC01_007408 [Tulasnella sp. 417]
MPTSLSDLPPKVVAQILLALGTREILRVRQTCKLLFAQTKSQKLWKMIAQRLLDDEEKIWPSWALPLDAIPVETIEDIVFRTKRLADVQRRVDDSGEEEIRTSFQGLILRPRDSPMWLHLIRGRWLLLQLQDFTLELWDLDDRSYARPAATCSLLKGFVDGIMVTEPSAIPEITISTTSFETFKFQPDLPFKSELRSPIPTLTAVNSFKGYSLLKAKVGRHLAFAASSGNSLRTCIVDELTRGEVELSGGVNLIKTERTLDVLIEDRIIVVARRRHVELYAASDLEQAFSQDNSAHGHRSIHPFQSISYPDLSLIHHAQFNAHVPSYLEAPHGSIFLTHFIDNRWHAFLLQPQLKPTQDAPINYQVEYVLPLAASDGDIYGISVGEGGCRCASVRPNCLAINYAKRWEKDVLEGYYTLISWEIPDSQSDLPRPACIAFDEAVGICVVGMGSGRIWIGDAVGSREMKETIIPSIPNHVPHPDPRWPKLPRFYFWDEVYNGPHPPDSSVRDEVVSGGKDASGWSTAIDYYVPWRNDPEAYGGIDWFVENVMGIPGPARTVLFSTDLLSREGYIDRPTELVDVHGQMFLVTNHGDDLFDVHRLVEGTTLEDVIDHLKNRRLGRLFVKDEELWVADYMPLYQHYQWYKRSDWGKLNK